MYEVNNKEVYDIYIEKVNNRNILQVTEKTSPIDIDFIAVIPPPPLPHPTSIISSSIFLTLKKKFFYR